MVVGQRNSGVGVGSGCVGKEEGGLCCVEVGQVEVWVIPTAQPD